MPRTPFPANWFLAKVSAALGAGRYSAVEAWAKPDGTIAAKEGGVRITSANPGYAVNGATLAANDIVLARPAPGAAGTLFELVPLGLSITGTDNRAVRMDGTGAIQHSAVTIDDTGGVTTAGLISSVAGGGTVVLIGGAFPAIAFSTTFTGPTRVYNLQGTGSELTLSIPNGQVFYLRGTPNNTPNAAYGIWDNGTAYTGWSGTFATGDARTVTVRGGIITAVS